MHGVSACGQLLLGPEPGGAARCMSVVVEWLGHALQAVAAAACACDACKCVSKNGKSGRAVEAAAAEEDGKRDLPRRDSVLTAVCTKHILAAISFRCVNTEKPATS